MRLPLRIATTLIPKLKRLQARSLQMRRHGLPRNEAGNRGVASDKLLGRVLAATGETEERRDPENLPAEADFDPACALDRRFEKRAAARLLAAIPLAGDRKIIRLYFGFDGAAMSLAGIGRRVHKSRDHVWSKIGRILRKLRDDPAAKGLEEQPPPWSEVT